MRYVVEPDRHGYRVVARGGRLVREFRASEGDQRDAAAAAALAHARALNSAAAAADYSAPDRQAVMA